MWATKVNRDRPWTSLVFRPIHNGFSAWATRPNHPNPSESSHFFGTFGNRWRRHWMLQTVSQTVSQSMLWQAPAGPERHVVAQVPHCFVCCFICLLVDWLLVRLSNPTEYLGMYACVCTILHSHLQIYMYMISVRLCLWPCAWLLCVCVCLWFCDFFFVSGFFCLGRWQVAKACLSFFSDWTCGSEQDKRWQNSTKRIHISL